MQYYQQAIIERVQAIFGRIDVTIYPDYFEFHNVNMPAKKDLWKMGKLIAESDAFLHDIAKTYHYSRSGGFQQRVRNSLKILILC